MDRRAAYWDKHAGRYDREIEETQRLRLGIVERVCARKAG
jgi:hypothetical protein